MLTNDAAAICKVCGKAFMRFNSMDQIVCSVPCARRVPVIAKNTAKAERKAHKTRLEAIKPRADWLKDAQKEVNTYVRLRDASLGCISCGKDHEGKYDAGHYLSTGARPELRFDEANIHKQCVPCNRFLHGNLMLYRAALIVKVGLTEVERLEGPHTPKKYTVDELKAIRDTYKAKVRELQWTALQT